MASEGAGTVDADPPADAFTPAQLAVIRQMIGRAEDGPASAGAQGNQGESISRRATVAGASPRASAAARSRRAIWAGTACVPRRGPRRGNPLT
jgi:hypothetical protein